MKIRTKIIIIHQITSLQKFLKKHLIDGKEKAQKKKNKKRTSKSLPIKGVKRRSSIEK